MKNEVEKRILECLNRVLSAPVETLGPEVNLRDELEMDSMTMVMFQVEIEETFQFTFDPIEDDFGKIFETIGSLSSYLESRK